MSARTLVQQPEVHMQGTAAIADAWDANFGLVHVRDVLPSRSPNRRIA